MNRWISVDDRLPKNSRYVLCCTQTKTGNINILRGFYDGKRWCCGMNSNVLFWMEMPEPPEEMYQKGVIIGRATKNYHPED